VAVLLNAGKLPDLRQEASSSRPWFIALYRLGCWIPCRGSTLERWISSGRGVFGLHEPASRGALQQMAVFAMGIMPYISVDHHA